MEVDGRGRQGAAWPEKTHVQKEEEEERKLLHIVQKKLKMEDEDLKK